MIAKLIARAGYCASESVLVATQRAGEPIEVISQGAVRAPLTISSRVYMASLSKQIVGACAALLVRAGRLDINAALTRWLPELPRWAGDVRLRHLLHHTAGLPDDRHIDAALTAFEDRSTEAVVAALTRMSSPARPPGTTFTYSNVGYVCLALAVERAAGQALAAFARDRVFVPLGMHDTLFWPGPDPMPPASIPLTHRHPAPLSLGDGGMWSTAFDILRWSRAINEDVLGISELLQTPGHLDDGRPLDYGWGVGVRTHNDYLVYRHGGGWPGIRLLHARAPGPGIGLLIVALDDDTERRVVLAEALLDTLFDEEATTGHNSTVA
jgi:CubicO group peptidase (beta-lactamase class C family)